MFREVIQRVFLLGGESEHSSEIALPTMFAADGSLNIRFPKDGKAESIDGYTKANSSAVTTDTGGSNAKCVGLYYYKSRASGSITRRLLGIFDDGTNEYEIHHSTDDGATWSFLKDLGSGAVGLFPSFVQYENKAFITFGGTIAVQEYNGSAITDAGQSQPAAPSVSAGASTGLTGTYKYRTASLDSAGLPGPASVPSTPVTLVNQDGSLSSIVNGAGGTRIWRTLGDGDVYFWLTDVANGTTVLLDSTDDKTLIDTGSEPINVGDAPQAGLRFCVQHRGRVYYAGTNADPNRIYYGDYGRGDSVSSVNFERVGEGEQGDKITGLFGEYEGRLVIPKEHSVWMLEGDGRSTFNFIRTQASTGFISDRAMALVPARAKFIDASGEVQQTSRPVVVGMTPNLDVRMFDGSSDTIVSWGKKTTFETMSYAVREEAWCIVYPAYNWVLFAIPTATGVFTYVGWDYSQGTWHEVNHFSTVAAVVVADTASGKVLFGGEATIATGGFVYKMFSGSSAAGSNITNTFRSIGLHFNSPSIRKQIQLLDPIFGAQSGSLSITIKTYQGFVSTGASAFSTHTLDIQLVNAIMANPGPIHTKDTNGAYPYDEAITLEFTRTGTTKWSLYGWTMKGMLEDVQMAKVR